MRYCIFSDIHANLEALEAVAEAVRTEKVDQWLCAGDVVGYGANPRECLAFIRSRKIPCVAGNHDWAVAGKFPESRFNAFAREAVAWTRQQLSGDERRFLADLPLVYQDEHIIVCHGHLQDAADFVYVLSVFDAASLFGLFPQPVCCVGHSHIPRIFCQKGKRVEAETFLRAETGPGQRFVMNPGSVGQPRDGDPRASYAIYDTGQQFLEVRRVVYPVTRAQKKIRAAGLPPYLADRLAAGV
jgi:predicted phosphodiesterase